MGANRYSCGISLGAIRAALMAKSSQNMAIFLQFLASLVLVLGVVTTVMNALGIQRTQTLGHMWDGGLGSFFPSRGTYLAREWSKDGCFGGQNQPLWRVRI